MCDASDYERTRADAAEAERAERAESRIDELLARLNTRTTGDVEGT